MKRLYVRLVIIHHILMCYRKMCKYYYNKIKSHATDIAWYNKHSMRCKFYYKQHTHYFKRYTHICGIYTRLEAKWFSKYGNKEA